MRRLVSLLCIFFLLADPIAGACLAMPRPISAPTHSQYFFQQEALTSASLWVRTSFQWLLAAHQRLAAAEGLPWYFFSSDLADLSASAGASARRKPVILFVDDDPSARSSMKNLLTAWGYEVHTAEDGQEGLKVFRSIQPDLLITDHHMPNASGLELITNVRRLHPGFPVIFMSGNVDDKEIAHTLNVDYIPKPPDTDQLESLVAQRLQSPRKMGVMPVALLGFGTAFTLFMDLLPFCLTVIICVVVSAILTNYFSAIWDIDNNDNEPPWKHWLGSATWTLHAVSIIVALCSLLAALLVAVVGTFSVSLSSWDPATHSLWLAAVPFIPVSQESDSSKAAVHAIDPTLTFVDLISRGPFSTVYEVRTADGQTRVLKVADGLMSENADEETLSKVQIGMRHTLATMDVRTAKLFKDTGRVAILRKIYGEERDEAGTLVGATAILMENMKGMRLSESFSEGRVTIAQLEDPSGPFWAMIDVFARRGFEMFDMKIDDIWWQDDGSLTLADGGALLPRNSDATDETVHTERRVSLQNLLDKLTEIEGLKEPQPKTPSVEKEFRQSA